MNKTFIPIPNKKTRWYLVNAEGKTLGRLATQIITILKGKNDIIYAPFLNSNHYIIIINAKNIKVTGNKISQKTYNRHSGQPGGLKVRTFEQLQQKLPHKILETAIYKMLPKSKLGKKLFKNIKVYSENTHPHTAQKPILFHL